MTDAEREAQIRLMAAHPSPLAAAGQRVLAADIDFLLGLIDRQAEALDRYRYAVAFAGADAWDGGSDIRERFSWARMADPIQLSDDCIAAIGAEFLACR